MKKVLKYVLIGLNALIILSLIILSGMLLYFSNAESPSLFGRSAILQNGGEGSESRLLFYENRTSQFTTGDILLLRSEDKGLSLHTVVQVEDGVPYCAMGDENLTPIDLTSPEYLGTVIGESTFWGGFAATLAKPGNLLLAFIIIGSCFLFCLLILFLVYFLGKRSESPVLEGEEDLLLLKELLEEEPTDETGTELPQDREDVPRPKASPFIEIPIRREETREDRISPKHPLASLQGTSHQSTSQNTPPSWRETPSAQSPSASPLDTEGLSEDVKIYTPRPIEPAPSIPEPEPEIVIHTYTETAYDIYDAQSPSIEDMLSNIEKQFREGLEDKDSMKR